MKVVFVTRDKGNGDEMKCIARALKERGHTVTLFLGEGKPMPEGTLEKIDHELQDADWLVVIPSSIRDRIEEERYALSRAGELGVRVYFPGQNYGTSYRNSWFGDLAKEASLLSVIVPEEIETARAHAGKGTKIFCAPNPDWNNYFFARYSPEEVGAKLGITPTKKLILGIGSKETNRNVLLYGGIIEACNYVRDEDIEIVFTIHPGAEGGTGVYDDLLKTSRHFVRFVSKEVISSQDMLPRADVTVTGGGSTLTPNACALGRPVIDLINEPDDVDWWRDISGYDYWAPAQQGASYLTRNAGQLFEGMKALFDPNSEVLGEQRRKQELHFRKSDFEGAAARIVAELESF